MGKKIIVYSTPTCTYCKSLKVYLNQKKLLFQDMDVSANQEKAQEMMEKSQQMGVPVIDIEGTIIIGFDKGKIDEALK